MYDVCGREHVPLRLPKFDCYAEKIRPTICNIRIGTYCLLLARHCIYYYLDLMQLLLQNIFHHLSEQRAVEAFDLCSIDLHSSMFYSGSGLTRERY